MKNKKEKTLSKKSKALLWITIPCTLCFITGIILYVFLINSNKLTTEKVNSIIAESIQISFDPIKENNNALISDVIECASVTVLSVKQKDDKTALAQCTIRTKDAYSAIRKIEETYGDESITAPALLDAYKKELKQSEFIEHTVEITLLKVEDSWTVDYSYEVLNALMGGYLQYSYEAMEQQAKEG